MLAILACARSSTVPKAAPTGPWANDFIYLEVAEDGTWSSHGEARGTCWQAGPNAALYAQLNLSGQWEDGRISAKHVEGSEETMLEAMFENGAWRLHVEVHHPSCDTVSWEWALQRPKI